MSAEQQERAAFEAWAKARTDWKPNLTRNDDGYVGAFAQSAWDAWQARAAPGAQPQAAQAVPQALTDHIEQRIRTWRQRTMNRSGDCLAIDDFMSQDSIDDLVDFVCDEIALAAAPSAPAQPWKDHNTRELVSKLMDAVQLYNGTDQLRERVAEVVHAYLPAPVTGPLLTDEQIDAIAEGMPDGLSGFLKSWGWRQFARAIEAAAPYQPATRRSCGWRAVPLGMPEAGLVDLLLQSGREVPFYIERDEEIMHGARPIIDLPSDATHWRP